MFAAVLLAAAPLISFESPGISVKELVQFMAAKTGQPLEAGHALEDDRLIVRFHDVPAADAMKALAKVEVGKWVASGSRVYLDKDSDEDRKLTSAEKAKLVAGWAEMIRRFESLMGPADYDVAVANRLSEQYRQRRQRRAEGGLNDFIRLEESEYSRPLGRALVRILESVGPEKLADYPEGAVDFASNPTSLQQSIGPDADSILRKYVQEQTLWDKVDARSAGSSDLSGVAGMIFQLSTHAHRPGGVAVLNVYDRQGRIVHDQALPLSLASVDQISKEIKKETEDKTHPELVPVPAICEELYRTRDEPSSRPLIATWWKDDPSFQEAVLHPELVDYDAQILGQQALAMARGCDENLILPEIRTLASFLPEGVVREGKMNAALLRTRLDAARTDFDLPNWYLVRPTSTEREYLAGQGAVDPRALGELSRSIASEGRLDLEPLADVAKDCDAGFGLGAEFGLVTRVHQVLHPDLPGLGWAASETPCLEFYGRLTREQRSLARTQGVSLAALTDYNWWPLVKNHWLLEGALKLKGLEEGGARTIYSDPFVFFGSVDSRRGALRIVDSSEDSLQVGGQGWTRFYDAKGYADSLKGGEKEPSPATSFRVGVRRTVKMLFEFTGRASMTLTLQCDDPSGDPASSYSGLPAEFRERFKPGSGQR
jgi:hypothetical protein